MLKRISALCIMLSAVVLLTAMGGKGGLEKAPRVEKNYSVEVTDVSGNKIDGHNFSWEGRINFSGSMGMAKVTIPFDKVKEMIVGDKKERKVKATVHLHDGAETVIEIDADARCYGEAGFGSFMLTMEEIRTIVFKKN